jgi:hypothetical protein
VGSKALAAAAAAAMADEEDGDDDDAPPTMGAHLAQLAPSRDDRPPVR